MFRFVNSYHKNGHKIAKVDPLQLNEYFNNLKFDEFDPKTYGLNINDNKQYPIRGILFNSAKTSMTLIEINRYLKNVYSDKISIEFDFIDNEEEKLWLVKEFERIRTTDLEIKTKKELLQNLIKSEVFFLTVFTSFFF